MKIQTLQAVLRDKSRQIGTGRLSFTINAESDGGAIAYVTHWFPTSDFGGEDCRAIGRGTIADVLDALDEYVEHPPHGPRKMVDSDLYIPVRSVPVAAE